MPDEITRTRNWSAAIAVIGIAAMLVTLVLPPIVLSRPASFTYLLIELFTIVISLLVVVVSYHSLAEQPHLPQANLLIFGFVMVAICDLAHALTYPGLPGYVADNGTTRTIFFRLMGRSAEVATLMAIAGSVSLRGSRTRWLLSGIGVCGVILWFGIFHIEWFPEVLRNRRQTPFKTGYEYTLALLNAGTAVVLWRTAIRGSHSTRYLLASSCVLMAGSNVILAQYRSPADFTYTFGQVFKVVAYALVYRAAFVRAITTPYQLLQQMGNELRGLNMELEKRVAQRTESLTHANRSLESFSYMIAHDLRAPLRHIDGFATLLAQDHARQLDDQGRHMLSNIRRSTATMYQMIDGILAVSKLEHSPLNRSTVDLGAMAEQIFADLQASEPRRRVEAAIQHPLQVEADPVLIRNVLMNLMSNAWKFTATKSHARLEVGALEQAVTTPNTHSELLVFYVRDNGTGFAPDQATRLFDLFQRLPGHSHVDGHGIGLASVRSIIANHGGTVWAEGIPGEGATFYFSLPILQRIQPTTATAKVVAVGLQ